MAQTLWPERPRSFANSRCTRELFFDGRSIGVKSEFGHSRTSELRRSTSYRQSPNVHLVKSAT
jgi:hypothetical protein